jgi:hypothetical protein
MSAMIDAPRPGETCGDLGVQTMKNGVATVEYTVGLPQPFARNVGLPCPGVGEGESRVDDKCRGDQGLYGSVHNSHPLLPLLSFN